MTRLTDLIAPVIRRFLPPKFTAELRPGEKLAVIGDVHGCTTELVALLDTLKSEAPEHQIVFVGDYVDRGEDSAGVLALLFEQPDFICLMGNHEVMCLEFLDQPEDRGRRWLRNGGLQTLSSYGIGNISDIASPDKLLAARDALAAAMGAPLIAWMRDLPYQWKSGNICITHAGADPDLAMYQQAQRSLIWGHPKFTTRARGDGLWVVHGHVIQPEASAIDGRIGVDTGAFATGRLSAALIDDAALRFCTS
ncbi:MAG: metallophosphoesterase [Rhodobacteraceae bacterium]|nr:metallophosphoesterase [Paracoccaceae bacterium]PHQ71237.1 MAG: hypothetical protein COB93_03605 [Sneathiella sp.]